MIYDIIIGQCNVVNTDLARQTMHLSMWRKFYQFS